MPAVALIKEGGLLPEDVSPAAATTQIGFSSLNALSVLALQAGCSRFRNHVGVRQAGLLHFQRVSSRFHGLFRPSFPATRRAPSPASPPDRRRRRATTTTFLQRLPPEDAVLAASDSFRRVASSLYPSTGNPSPSFHPLLPSFRRVNFDTKNSSSPARQTPEPPFFIFSQPTIGSIRAAGQFINAQSCASG